jgi:anti-sigma regulatory factor (Ser/Thr protein kinase)
MMLGSIRRAGRSRRALGAIVSVGEGFHDVRDSGRRHVRRVSLPNDSSSVKTARDVVADVLTTMGWPEHTIDRARVVASELVTNAVMHAGTAFELTIRVDDACWIEVTDGAPAELPQRVDHGGSRPGGMGLYLVDALAAEWGVERDPTCKVVWARLSACELAS